MWGISAPASESPGRRGEGRRGGAARVLCGCEVLQAALGGAGPDCSPSSNLIGFPVSCQVFTGGGKVSLSPSLHPPPPAGEESQRPGALTE